MSYGNYEFRYVRGHIEVFLYGVFQFSADTVSEAQADFSRTPALLSHQCSDDYDAGVPVLLPVLLGAAEPDVWRQ